LLANNESTVRDRLVCWTNYRPLRLPDQLTFDDVARLASDRQYSFQVADDGSILQLFYQFDESGRSVKNATLAYLQGQPAEHEDVELNDQYMDPPDEGGPEPAAIIAASHPQWIRIDFEENGSRCPIHADCHLHLAGFPTSRITLSNLPSPKQFVEMVMAWFYPDSYRAHRLDSLNCYKNPGWMKFVNRQTMECEDTESNKHLAHLRIPKAGFF
jgi:hypothetical protein